MTGHRITEAGRVLPYHATTLPLCHCTIGKARGRTGNIQTIKYDVPRLEASPVPSGVGEVGAGPGFGAQAKTALAHYWCVQEVITRCGCARRREPAFTIPRPLTQEEVRAYWLGGIPGRLR